MKLLRFAVAALLASVLLSGCKDAPGPSAPGQPAAKAPVTTAAIEAEAKGFTVGSTMSTRTVYVFFDPQCPHCAVLWQAAKPLKSQAKFVWIPVGIINKTSVGQGATILAAKDPVAAMDEHETSILAKQGGIGASGDSDAQKARRREEHRAAKPLWLRVHSHHRGAACTDGRAGHQGRCAADARTGRFARAAGSGGTVTAQPVVAGVRLKPEPLENSNSAPVRCQSSVESPMVSRQRRIISSIRHSWSSRMRW